MSEDYVHVEEIRPNFKCDFCLKLLENAYQCVCHKKVCQSHVEKEEITDTCPVLTKHSFGTFDVMTKAINDLKEKMMVECTICLEKCKFNDWETHKSENCFYQCELKCSNKIKRGNEADHLKTCPNAEINCEGSKIGCPFKDKRNIVINFHENECHLAKFIKELFGSLGEMKKEISELKQNQEKIMSNINEIKESQHEITTLLSDSKGSIEVVIRSVENLKEKQEKLCESSERIEKKNEGMEKAIIVLTEKNDNMENLINILRDEKPPKDGVIIIDQPLQDEDIIDQPLQDEGDIGETKGSLNNVNGETNKTTEGIIEEKKDNEIDQLLIDFVELIDAKQDDIFPILKENSISSLSEFSDNISTEEDLTDIGFNKKLSQKIFLHLFVHQEFASDDFPIVSNLLKKNCIEEIIEVENLNEKQLEEELGLNSDQAKRMGISLLLRGIKKEIKGDIYKILFDNGIFSFEHLLTYRDNEQELSGELEIQQDVAKIILSNLPN